MHLEKLYAPPHPLPKQASDGAARQASAIRRRLFILFCCLTATFLVISCFIVWNSSHADFICTPRCPVQYIVIVGWHVCMMNFQSATMCLIGSGDNCIVRIIMPY